MRRWIASRLQFRKATQAGYSGAVKDPARDLYRGLIRMHVLLHALHEPIFGLEMIEELQHHGYRIGPGTLYPLLHGLERAGLLRSSSPKAGGRRRMYTITAAGRRALEAAKAKVDELYHELHEAHPQMRASLPETRDQQRGIHG